MLRLYLDEDAMDDALLKLIAALSPEQMANHVEFLSAWS